MAKVADAEGGSTASLGKLNNVLMQMRKNCNHPDLITGPFSASTAYPTPAEMVEQCGKMALLQRLLDRLKAGGHKVLIFSQVRARARGGACSAFSAAYSSTHTTNTALAALSASHTHTHTHTHTHAHTHTRR